MLGLTLSSTRSLMIRQCVRDRRKQRGGSFPSSGNSREVVIFLMYETVPW
jgi:hypothetical protein